jgi:hypothetical protein
MVLAATMLAAIAILTIIKELSPTSRFAALQSVDDR